MGDAGPYLLGLDAGNTIIKAVLFDTNGRQIAAHGVHGATSTPAPGMVERSVQELWQNARTAISGCIAAAGIAPTSIAAIGAAGHGNGLYLLDRNSEPLLGVQSLDTRAATIAADLDRASGAQIHAITSQRPWPSQTPALLAWLKRHRPGVFEQAGTLLFAKDVLSWHLTGERASDISDMSGAGLLRLPEAEYENELLALYGLAECRALLPPLHNPTDIVGTVTRAAAAATGLARGTPVVAGLFDVVASALGSGAVGDGAASIVVGSWSINQVLSHKRTVDDSVFMVSAYGKNRFSNLECSATSAANLEWYVRTLLARSSAHDDPYELVDRAVGTTAPAASDPFFHPFLYGGRLGAYQRGGFFGLAGWHAEGHLLRAVLEGIMFEHRRHISVLDSAGVTFGSAALSGGGTRSPHWPQIFADGLNVPVTIAEAQETGALGAAMTAAVGAGIFIDDVQAVGAMTRIAHTFVPDAAMVSHYTRRYDFWMRLTKALDPFWYELSIS